MMKYHISVLCILLATVLVTRDGVDAFVGNELANYDVCQRSLTSNIHHKTALLYKDRDDGASPSLIIPKRGRLSKKKYKANKKSSRSFQRHKKGGMPVAGDDLAQHVQSVFSDLTEFSGSESEEICIFSEPEEDDESSTICSTSRQQIDSCKKLDRHPALVLNADYQPLRMLPLSIWSWQNTVKAVLSGKAVVVDVYPNVFVRAVDLDMPVPSIIALREYAPTGKARPAFTRRNVYLRDGYRCQYCSDQFHTPDLSLDHVEPRCFGGRLEWENTVTSCRECNGRKGCLRPSELNQVGMKLTREPRCPSLFELAAEASKFVPRKVHPTWAPFLPGTMESN